MPETGRILRRRALAAALLAALALGVSAPAPVAQTTLPARLSDNEFWGIVEDMSEPDGFFRSDNLVSNEDTFQIILPELLRTVKPGGVYIGVGPDQNFTYVAALKPAVVFIPDIRRGNLLMHLMYKALMELSPDRATFLSRLFSRPKPTGVDAQAPPDRLFQAFAEVPGSREMYDGTSADILNVLRKQHGFKLSDSDVSGIQYILSSFFAAGPFLQYSSAPAARGLPYPSFAELQTATDGAGVARAYLATEDNYRFIRTLQQRNLIVPLVGNFGGPKTLRALGAWTRARGARVTLFYTSNVEQYLFQDRLWESFAENIASMPLDETSTLIRSCFNTCFDRAYNSRVVMLLDSMQGMVAAHRSGQVLSYYDVLSRRR